MYILAAFLRYIIRKGFSVIKQERLLNQYKHGELSFQEVCQQMKCTPWDFLSILKAKKLNLNVGLEDWLDSASLVE